MDSHFTVRCALKSSSMRIQNSYDARCHCATRIGNIYRVERKCSEHDIGTILKKAEPFGDRFGVKIAPLDFLADHFPMQPSREFINVVCDIDFPSSPVSSSSGRSSIKRACDWSDEESSSDDEHNKKRAKTRSLSPISLNTGSFCSFFDSSVELVKHSNYTLFVGIDDYDAPSRRRFFANTRELDEDCLSQQDIESYIDSFLWGPLQKASAAIDKLLVAGTCHLQSHGLKNLRLLDLNIVPGQRPSIAELRRSCGAYTFSPPDANNEAAEPVLHPQRFLSRLSELSLRPPLSGDARSFSLLSSILRLLPDASDVPGVVSTNDLAALVAAGAVHIDEPMDAPLHQDDASLPWSALYYAGALTYDRQTPGTFRLANSVVLSMIQSHIARFVDERYDVQDAFSCAVHNWNTDSNRTLFTEMLSVVLQDQTTYSLGTLHEPDLRGVLELVVGNIYCEYSRFVGPIELFSSTGFSRVRVKDPADKNARRWELRTLTLRSMWRATNANDAEPSDDDEALLARPYAAWSPALNTTETVLVRSFVETATDVPLFVAVGGARVLAARRS
ncbi:hypothetical protein B0H17DRAFT_1337615 [Mycena rosella]|uniref:Uncharacterized protein n=1 Tax=Mycena rosella TaxID=1033263 RepID=A0AAD7CRA5_MYCRO|nr:hypothetical protein B0H17DRAFT_1337615 [Mycena rosella]